MKKCSVCKETKELTEFNACGSYNNIKLYRPQCKKCRNKKLKTYRDSNKDSLNAAQREWRKDNPDKHRIYRLEYSNRDYVKEKSKKWKLDNPEKVRLYQKRFSENAKNNIFYSLSNRMGNALRKGLKRNKLKKHWENIVGYTVDELRKHLEERFLEGMTWELFLKGEIHIDHIRPKSLYNYQSFEDEEFKKCWSLDNLQPLWRIDNIKKSNKI